MPIIPFLDPTYPDMVLEIDLDIDVNSDRSLTCRRRCRRHYHKAPSALHV